jgi:CelD/BcsL family acetyltransferase involved in cellulose biosynthesis
LPLKVATETLTGVAQEWDELADRASGSPFLRPGWFSAWGAAFGAEVSVLAARDGGRLVGALPFVGGRLWLRSPTNWHTPVFGPLAESASAHEALFGALLARRPPLVDMVFADSADPALAAWRGAAAAARWRVVERVRMRSPYISLEGGDFESYRASLGRKMRKELGRLARRLGDEGELAYEFWDGRGPGGSERLDSLLEEGFRVEGSGWKGESGTAIVSHSETHRFYRDVGRWAAGRGSLVLAFLRLDGRPLAFDMCIEEAGASNVLKGGFDPEFRRFGPGTLLTAASIERAFSLGLSSYELLGAEDEYKLAWTSEARERLRFQAFPPTPAGRVSHLAWTRGRAVAKRAQAEVARRRAERER